MRVLVLAGALCALSTGAMAQDFEAWGPHPELGNAVETITTDDVSGDHWWRFRVSHYTSNGIVLEALGFDLSVGNYGDPTPSAAARRLEGRSAGRVVLTTDRGESFTAAEASYQAEEGADLSITMSFTPMEDDDGVLQASEPNCRVIQALRRSSSFTVRFRGLDGEDEREFTGEGSARALVGFGGC